MRRRAVIRGLLLAISLVAAAALVGSWATSPADLTAVAATQTERPVEERDRLVPARNGTTVVTTDPPGGTNGTAAIVAFGPGGRPRYHDDSYGNYFDVDPDPPGSNTVLYVAGTRYDPCPALLAARANVSAADGCAEVVVERANLTTGATERVHAAVTGWDVWHDVDRVGEHRLLVADIANDRVFVLNTTTDEVAWEWRAETAFGPDSGGRAGDWTHVNDVEALADGRVMVSLRNHDRVVFLDPGRGVQREWTLGAEDAYGVLYEQHNPDFLPAARGGPAVLVADSENNRVVEYQRVGGGEVSEANRTSSDASDGTWTRTWSWRDDRLRWPRDADRLPGGHTLVTDSQGDRVLELDADGDVVWRVRVSTPYEAERLGTGDESATGRSAAALADGTESRPGSTDGTDSGRTTGLAWVVAFLTGPVVNGLLYAAPAWMTVGDLTVAGVLATTALALVVLEVRWSRWNLSAIRRRR